MQVLSDSILAIFKPDTDMPKLDLEASVSMVELDTVPDFAGLIVDQVVTEAAFSMDMTLEAESHDAILEKLGVPPVKEVIDTTELKGEVSVPVQFLSKIDASFDKAIVKIEPVSDTEFGNLSTTVSPPITAALPTKTIGPESNVSIDDRPTSFHSFNAPKIKEAAGTPIERPETIKIQTSTRPDLPIIAVPPVPQPNLRRAEGELRLVPEAKPVGFQPLQIQTERPLTDILVPTVPIEHRRDAGNRPDPVSVRQGPIDQQIVAQVSEKLSLLSEKTIEIQLAPKELGKVVFSVTTADSGAVTVTISAERDDVSYLMRRHIDEFARDFQKLGFGQVNFAFSGQSQKQMSSADNPKPNPNTSVLDIDDLEPTHMSISTGIDIRL